MSFLYKQCDHGANAKGEISPTAEAFFALFCFPWICFDLVEPRCPRTQDALLRFPAEKNSLKASSFTPQRISWVKPTFGSVSMMDLSLKRGRNRIREEFLTASVCDLSLLVTRTEHGKQRSQWVTWGGETRKYLLIQRAPTSRDKRYECQTNVCEGIINITGTWNGRRVAAVEKGGRWTWKSGFSQKLSTRL